MALTERVFVLRLRSVAPLGLNKCVSLIHPGLAPWAMQEYRPKGLSSTSSYHFIILMRLHTPRHKRIN